MENQIKKDEAVTSEAGQGKNESIEIIDNPKLRSVLRTIGEWSFTTVIWVVWVYLFFPIINILLWVFGVHRFYSKVIADSEYMRLLGLIERFGWAVLLIFLVLWLWGLYNYHRFGKKNRRRAAAPTSPEKLSSFFGVNVEEVIDLQQKKEIHWTRLYSSSEETPKTVDPFTR